MDCVWKVKESDQNEELRYSIRSVATNWPDARIVIAGYKPSWLKDVYHIPIKQVRGEKHRNADLIVKTVLTSLTISDPFWLADDDMYVLHKSPVDEGPVLHWGPMKDVLEHNSERTIGKGYYPAMQRTLDILDNLGLPSISYACHTPLLTYKEGLLKAMDFIEYDKEIQYSSIYGNQVGLGGHRITDDVKVYSLLEVPDWVGRLPYLSTSDRSFSHGYIGRWIRERFPEASRYEVW